VTGLIFAVVTLRMIGNPSAETAWNNCIVCTIRKARLPDDKPAIVEFIMALQRYESSLESNRLFDLSMAEAYYTALLDRLARGAIFIAEDDAARIIGWAMVYEEQTEAFVRPDERTFAYLAELYVSESARGTGAGKRLIGASEQWAVANGYTTMRIDHLATNEQAARAYAKAGYAPYCQEVKKRLTPVAAQTAGEVIPFRPSRFRRQLMMAAE